MPGAGPQKLNHPVIPFATPLLTDLFFFADQTTGLGKKNYISKLLSLLGISGFGEGVVDVAPDQMEFPFQGKSVLWFTSSNSIAVPKGILFEDADAALSFKWVINLQAGATVDFENYDWVFKGIDSRFENLLFTPIESGLHLIEGDRIGETTWYLRFSPSIFT